jgi:excisionase family DNA binding protein
LSTVVHSVYYASNMDTNKLLYKPAEAADVLGVSRARVYELIAEGTIPSIRLGASLRVPVDALQQRIADLAQKRTDDAA